MVLSNTVDKMLSEDYKERFIAEYQQLSIRHDGLKKMLDNWDKGNLNFIRLAHAVHMTCKLKQ